MSLLGLVLVLLISGIVLALVPVEPAIKRLTIIVLAVIVAVVLILWLVRVLGIPDVRLP